MFFKKRSNAAAARIATLSSLAFIAAAVWAWDLPLQTVGHYFLITLVLVGALMLLAGIVVLLIKGVQKLLRKP